MSGYASGYLVIDSVLVAIFLGRGIYGLKNNQPGNIINWLFAGEFTIDAIANIVSTKQDGGTVPGEAAVRQLIARFKTQRSQRRNPEERDEEEGQVLEEPKRQHLLSKLFTRKNCAKMQRQIRRPLPHLDSRV